MRGSRFCSRVSDYWTSDVVALRNHILIHTPKRGYIGYPYGRIGELRARRKDLRLNTCKSCLNNVGNEYGHPTDRPADAVQ